jgi:hypothetical protein
MTYLYWRTYPCMFNKHFTCSAHVKLLKILLLFCVWGELDNRVSTVSRIYTENVRKIENAVLRN